MYICICKAVTDNQVRTAINNGVCTRRQLTHCLGVGRDCGKCNKDIKALLEQCTQQTAINSMMALSTA